MLPTCSKADEKHLPGLPGVRGAAARPSSSLSQTLRLLIFAALGAFAWYRFDVRDRLDAAAAKDAALERERIVRHGKHGSKHGWGPFPQKGDPFHFLPCTDQTLPPALEESHPTQAWQRLYDPNPEHWSRGSSGGSGDGERGLYLCGWLDVPLDYTNSTLDRRIARLAVTKFQHRPTKSKRTMVVEPGGPGGSGTNLVWRKAELFARDYSDNTMDVLGWDPRGVNASQPSISCFPYDADRDRWSLSTSIFYREAQTAADSTANHGPRSAMLKADAMNQAILEACQRKYGDIAGMLTTAFVARDLERIRKALREDLLNGYFISYGTGIGQTYVNMFPDAVGRLMLDGTEFVRDQRMMGGFGWAALDNITAAFQDGFLGECVAAGPERCALAQPMKHGDSPPTRQGLIDAMDDLFARLVQRPIPGHTKQSGPIIITYSQIISVIYGGLYNPFSWDALAAAFYDLLQGNSTLISQYVDSWEYNPALPPSRLPVKHSSDELGLLVICSDQWDSPLPPNYDVDTNGEEWYLDLWQEMTSKSEIGGNGRFVDILPCRHWNATFSPPKEVYRGDLNHSLSNPVLLIAETYDPATPLRNGQRLLHEMGPHNARLIAHHGYGHSSRDTSNCTNTIMRNYMLNGVLPDQPQTDCFADKKPYRYTDPKNNNTTTTTIQSAQTFVQQWHAHLAELQHIAPHFAQRRP